MVYEPRFLLLFLWFGEWNFVSVVRSVYIMVASHKHQGLHHSTILQGPATE